MYAAVTLKSRQRRMKDFYNLSGSKYVLIGRTTPWTNENVPPIPTGNETQLTELIGGKIIQNQWYAKMLTNPTQEQMDAGVYYKGHYYYKTDDVDTAIAQGCDCVLVYVELDRDELPLQTYRQVGLQTQVGNSSITMTPSQFNALTNKGQLEVIENRKPQTRENDQMESITILVQF